jgi:transcriptional regulator with XRE-family HTH domain
MGIPESIKKRRKDLDFTLLDIAKKIGVSEATVQRYESGQIKNLRQDKIVRLAAALQITPAQLLGWEVDEPPYIKPQVNENIKAIDIQSAPPVASFDPQENESLYSDPDKTIELLEKVAALHAKGILTDEEYLDKKRELLKRL